MNFFSIVHRFFTIETIYLSILQITCPTSYSYSNISLSNSNKSWEDDFIYIGDIIVPRPSLIEPRVGGGGPIGGPWPGGIIPYIIENFIDDQSQEFVEFLMGKYFTLTNGCVRFRKRYLEPDFLLVRIHNDKCASSVGYRRGPNILELGPACLSSQIILHELYHAVGFVHEQNRIDRDYYVTINYHNVKPGQHHNFEIVREMSTFGLPYDFGSIVHYDQFSFSGNGLPTIIAKDPRFQHLMGTATTLSVNDVLRIERRYNCRQ